MTAKLLIQGTSVNLQRAEASETAGFILSSPLDIQIDTLLDVNVLAAMEQHLRIWSNRFYGGHVVVEEISSSVEDVNGLRGTVRVPLAIVLDENARNLADVHQPEGASSILRVAITITAEKLRNPLPYAACTAE